MAGNTTTGHAGGDATARILEWYSRLYSRRVDLVGDFAGSERFLVHGESLLLQCFSDRQLDFDPGYQLLHASYAVEKFLYGLVSRRCNFHIAFFDDAQDLCVPQGASPATREKYLLARAAIIRHLQVNLQTSHSDIEVHRFSSTSSDTFADYLRSTDIYFVLCHDGASVKDLRKRALLQKELDVLQDEEASLNDRQKTYKSSFRTLIYGFLQRGYSTALINGLEWQDTKVITTILEHSRKMDIVIPVSVIPVLAIYEDLSITLYCLLFYSKTASYERFRRTNKQCHNVAVTIVPANSNSDTETCRADPRDQS
jgi:hypothetical protein